MDAIVTAGLVGTLLGGIIAPTAGAAPATTVSAPSHRADLGHPLDWPGLPDRHPADHHPAGHHSAPPTRRPRPAPIGLVSPAPRLPTDDAEVVTVRAGDSLWSLAATRLGPAATAGQIAAAWPLWYAANRRVIGPDPSLIRPGQRLRPPTPTASAHRSHRPTGSTP